MKNEDFKELVDRRLSGLVWDEASRRKVLNAVHEEEKPMKKKVSFTVVLALAVLCIAAVAIAEGLMFSPRYSAVRLANQAMEQQYGITPDILSLFYRQVEQHADGSATVTYSVPGENGLPAEQMGEYTVEVKDNRAKASWSNEGKDTSGGLAAEAFGAEQLRLLSYDYDNAMRQLMEAGTIQPKAYPSPLPLDSDSPTPLPIVWTAEDQAEADKALAEWEKADQERRAEIAKAEAEGKLAVQAASDLAREAICQEYALTEDQSKKLNFEPDSTFITWQAGQPEAHMLFWLWQGEDDTFHEKDGQYWVKVNLNTGVIEDIIYDSGLAANG